MKAAIIVLLLAAIPAAPRPAAPGFGSASGLQDVSDFLRIGGAVTNVCAPFPCYAGGYTGP